MRAPRTIRRWTLPLALLAVAACGTPSAERPSAPASEGLEHVEATSSAPAVPDVPAEPEEPLEPTVAIPAPSFAPFRDLAPDACLARVRSLGIPHRERAHEAVAAGMIVEGDVGGVTWEFDGRLDIHRVMDCRLVLALHAWAPTLRAAGITKVRHLSALRPSARVRSTGAPSGHARGLAVDPRHFELADGTTLDVLEDWTFRERGTEPCAEVEEPASSKLLRGVVCRAIEAGLFQVVVTPHHDDAHANHVHVEVVPDIAWTWAR